MLLMLGGGSPSNTKYSPVGAKASPGGDGAYVPSFLSSNKGRYSRGDCVPSILSCSDEGKCGWSEEFPFFFYSSLVHKPLVLVSIQPCRLYQPKMEYGSKYLRLI